MKNKPAVGEFGPHILQVRVAHVLDGEDEAVLVLIQTLAHIGEKLQGQLLALLLDLGEVNDSRALGFRHCEGRIWGGEEDSVGLVGCSELSIWKYYFEPFELAAAS